MGDTTKISSNDIAWNSPSSNKFITSPMFLNFAPPCGGRFCLSQDFGKKHTNPALSSKTCWSLAIVLLSNAGYVLYSTLRSKMQRIRIPSDSSLLSQTIATIFREFLRLCIQNKCTVALPIHKWFQDLPWFWFPQDLPNMAPGPSWGRSPQPTSDCSASCIEDASLSCGEAEWMGTFSNLVPSMWQVDLVENNVSKLRMFARLMMFFHVLKMEPLYTWSNFWIHPWKLTAGYTKWWFSSQFSISFQIWYRKVKFPGCNPLWILSQGLLMRLLGQLRGRGTWLYS